MRKIASRLGLSSLLAANDRTSNLSGREAMFGEKVDLQTVAAADSNSKINLTSLDHLSVIDSPLLTLI